MGEKTKISWTESTWNPVIGCSHVSPGCEHCYAESLALRYGWSKHPWGAQWAKENVILKPHKLMDPLKWKTPRRIFVNSLSDVFHEQIPDDYIAKMFAIMALAPEHTFQVLTKRPQRMRDWMRANDHASVIQALLCDTSFHFAARFWGKRFDAMLAAPTRPLPWPLPNVWLGVSVEDQRRMDERYPLLLQTPAAVHFISFEPLLGPIEAATWFASSMTDAGTCALNWAIIGGESGPNYRPMNLDWARSLRDQCHAAGVAYFYKQSSGARSGMNPTLDGIEYHEWPSFEARAVIGREPIALGVS